MSPAKHSEAEEAAFMANLLSGIDESFFDAVPSPDPPARVLKSSSPYRSPCRNKGTTRSPLRNQALFKTPTKSRKGSAANATSIASLLEGAENWDWDDMNDDFMTPKKPTKGTGTVASSSSASLASSRFSSFSSATTLSSVSSSKSALGAPALASPPCTRCVVKEVRTRNEEGFYYKELTVVTQPLSEHRRVVLQDDWTDLEITADDVLNIIGTFQTPPAAEFEAGSSASPALTAIPSITLTSRPTTALLILHPDILITATSLAATPTCLRKPILTSLIHSSSDVTPALVWGNMLHEVMQSCLLDWTNGATTWDESEMDRKIEKEVKRGLGDLLKLNISVEQAKRELKARAVGLRAFQQRYISDTPKPEANLTNTRSERGQSSLLAISNLHDIEEDIWSPTYGIKGKLDVSVQAVIEDMVASPSQNPRSSVSTATSAKGKNAKLGSSEPMVVATRKHPMPLELKTGRSTQVMEHRAQTLLYTLLMEERYATPVPSGLLYYTQSDEVVRVPRSTNELRALLLKRNEMAAYLARRMGKESKSFRKGDDVNIEEFLPPTIDDLRVCGKCYVVDTCMLYRKTVERVHDTSSAISDIYALKTDQITPAQAKFFSTWERLISFEERDLIRFRKELWTMTAKERETCGRCFSDMVLDEGYQHDTATLKTFSKRDGRIHQFTYRFTKAASLFSHSDSQSLLNGHMSAGDAVTISVEPDLLALVRGFIVSLEPSEVVIGVDHELSVQTILARRPQLAEDLPVVFRIDKDELFGGMGRIRGNLANLFYADGDTRRLELVVDLRPPRFAELPPGPLVPSHEKAAEVIESLNTNQQVAVRKVLSTMDYSLILGMPGTGKTTVIAAIIRALVCLGKTVLLTSYTHSAVDTILLKLQDATDFRILRLGNLDKIHPDVRKFTLAANQPATTIEQLEHQVMSPPVIATTCLTIDHPLFARRTFDYCIVDEASQVTLPTCLGPLRFADKFVLVGDHFQLPPLVRNREAKRGGLDVSLFRRLSEAHSEAVVDLNEQYRMNEDIMVLSNKLIYSDRLRCGSEAVAKRSLGLPRPEFLKSIHASPVSECPRKQCWIEHLLDKSCKAVFVDTDNVPAQDSRIGDLTQNVTEAALVHQVTETFIGCGVREEEIGVISLYRQQIKLLSHLLQERKGVEILTADRSQGRDKECIIISMVRSNDAGQIGDLLKDWRRINVSFTRARSKLIIFGSRRTLKTEPLLEEFFKLMDSRGWILTLPPDADKLHASLVPAISRKRLMSAIEDTPPSSPSRDVKKAKKMGLVDEGILRGRPILKDLMNDTA